MPIFRVLSNICDTVIGDANSACADNDAIAFFWRNRIPGDFQFRKCKTGDRNTSDLGAEDKVARRTVSAV
jgi:hypothetical protein